MNIDQEIFSIYMMYAEKTFERFNRRCLCDKRIETGCSRPEIAKTKQEVDETSNIVLKEENKMIK